MPAGAKNPDDSAPSTKEVAARPAVAMKSQEALNKKTSELLKFSTCRLFYFALARSCVMLNSDHFSRDWVSADRRDGR